MNALYAMAATVPWSRVLREYRPWLLPLGAVIAINLGVLLSVVLPLSRAVEASERQAAGSAQALAAATADFRNAEDTRRGQVQATSDLDRFYREVLPADAASARRITHLKLSQMARAHDVTFERSAASPEPVTDSELERLKVSYGFSGSWNDIRQFLFDIETGDDFLIIDNVMLSEGADNSSPLSLTLDLSTYYRSTGSKR